MVGKSYLFLYFLVLQRSIYSNINYINSQTTTKLTPLLEPTQREINIRFLNARVI